jgi:hypothetical protein
VAIGTESAEGSSICAKGSSSYFADEEGTKNFFSPILGSRKSDHGRGTAVVVLVDGNSSGDPGDSNAVCACVRAEKLLRLW